MGLTRNIIDDINSERHSFISYLKQTNRNKNRQIRIYNWWDEPYDSIWLKSFVIAHNLIPENQVLNLMSVFGRKNVARYITKGPTIFFAGENLHSHYQQYADYCLKDSLAQLGLGFDYFENEHYFRFPLWMTYMFSPESTESEVIRRCEELRYPHIGTRPLFASMIARYDILGGRKSICSALNKIDFISCPSKVNHNDETLITVFNDNKDVFLRQFAFNICPENTNSYGYVTEKIFQAINAGCIPIYWGSYNTPETDIINPDAVIFWNMDGDNEESIRLIEDLWTNKNHLAEFMHQPRLKKNAEERVLQKMYDLSMKVRTLF